LKQNRSGKEEKLKKGMKLEQLFEEKTSFSVHCAMKKASFLTKW
jgi:hypothetical protein